MGCYILLKLKSIRLLFLHSYYATQLFGSYPFWLWERALIAFFVWAILFPSILFVMNTRSELDITLEIDATVAIVINSIGRHFSREPLGIFEWYSIHLIPIERIWRTHYYCCWRVSIALYRFRRRIEFSTLSLTLWLFFLCLFHLRHARLISRSHICRPQSQSLGTAVYWVYLSNFCFLYYVMCFFFYLFIQSIIAITIFFSDFLLVAMKKKMSRSADLYVWLIA